MQPINTVLQRQYPVIYEADQPSAVIIDIESYRLLELLLDNLVNRGDEPEDGMIAAATTLWQRLMREAPADRQAEEQRYPFWGKPITWLNPVDPVTGEDWEVLK
jgi:hypothetical protein